MTLLCAALHGQDNMLLSRINLTTIPLMATSVAKYICFAEANRGVRMALASIDKQQLQAHPDVFLRAVYQCSNPESLSELFDYIAKYSPSSTLDTPETRTNFTADELHAVPGKFHGGYR